MNIEKIIKLIRENDEKKIDKYVNVIKKIVTEEPEYYYNKKYSEFFKKSN